MRACASPLRPSPFPPPLLPFSFSLLSSRLPPPSLFPVPHHRRARCACPTLACLACLVARSARQVSGAPAARNPSPIPSSFLPLLTLLSFSLLRDACCMLRHAQCVLRNAQCAMRDACCAMRAAQCVLRNACCAMRAAQSVLRKACCAMRAAQCVLRNACCAMRDACCAMRVACCV